MKRLKSMMAVLSAVSLLGAAGAAQAGATLDAVKKKGFVQCGVSDGLPGFSYVDAQGKYLALTSTYAGPSRRRCSAMPTRSSTVR